jgi:hypothetical protein
VQVTKPLCADRGEITQCEPSDSGTGCTERSTILEGRRTSDRAAADSIGQITASARAGFRVLTQTHCSRINPARGDGYVYSSSLDVHFRSAMAPEARFGLRTENWRFALGGYYGMGWRVRHPFLHVTGTPINSDVYTSIKKQKERPNDKNYYVSFCHERPCRMRFREPGATDERRFRRRHRCRLGF